jgi:hypothetical protein
VPPSVADPPSGSPGSSPPPPPPAPPPPPPELAELELEPGQPVPMARTATASTPSVRAMSLPPPPTPAVATHERSRRRGSAPAVQDSAVARAGHDHGDARDGRSFQDREPSVYRGSTACSQSRRASYPSRQRRTPLDGAAPQSSGLRDRTRLALPIESHCAVRRRCGIIASSSRRARAQGGSAVRATPTLPREVQKRCARLFLLLFSV